MIVFVDKKCQKNISYVTYKIDEAFSNKIIYIDAHKPFRDIAFGGLCFGSKEYNAFLIADSKLSDESFFKPLDTISGEILIDFKKSFNEDCFSKYVTNTIRNRASMRNNEIFIVANLDNSEIKKVAESTTEPYIILSKEKDDTDINEFLNEELNSSVINNLIKCNNIKVFENTETGLLEFVKKEKEKDTPVGSGCCTAFHLEIMNPDSVDLSKVDSNDISKFIAFKNYVKGVINPIRTEETVEEVNNEATVQQVVDIPEASDDSHEFELDTMEQELVIPQPINYDGPTQGIDLMLNRLRNEAMQRIPINEELLHEMVDFNVNAA